MPEQANIDCLIHVKCQSVACDLSLALFAERALAPDAQHFRRPGDVAAARGDRGAVSLWLFRKLVRGGNDSAVAAGMEAGGEFESA